jgi:hypothetical protein
MTNRDEGGQINRERLPRVAVSDALKILKPIPIKSWERVTYLEPRTVFQAGDGRIFNIEGFETIIEVSDGRLIARVERETSMSFDFENHSTAVALSPHWVSHFRLRFLGEFDGADADSKIPLDFRVRLEEESAIAEFYAQLDKQKPKANTVGQRTKIISALHMLIEGNK